MRKTILASAATLALCLSGAVLADGAALFTAKGCVACHGADGNAPTAPMYPKLAGQSAAYTLTQMKDIKSGTRANGMSMVMKPIIATVSDAEMKEISDWLATK